MTSYSNNNNDIHGDDITSWWCNNDDGIWCHMILLGREGRHACRWTWGYPEGPSSGCTACSVSHQSFSPHSGEAWGRLQHAACPLGLWRRGVWRKGRVERRVCVWGMWGECVHLCAGCTCMMCMCMHVCPYIVCVHACICMCMHVHMCMRVCLSVCALMQCKASRKINLQWTSSVDEFWLYCSPWSVKLGVRYLDLFWSPTAGATEEQQAQTVWGCVACALEISGGGSKLWCERERDSGGGDHEREEERLSPGWVQRASRRQCTAPGWRISSWLS